MKLRWVFFLGKFDFGKIRQKSIREGAASSGLYFRTTFAHFYFTKTFQKLQKLLLSKFQHIFNEVLLISRSIRTSFSKKWKYLRFYFKFPEQTSVSCYGTPHTSCSRSIDFTAMWVRSELLTRSGLKVKKWNKYLNHSDLNIFSISCSATANLLLSAQRNTFSLTSSTCKKLNNDERSVTKQF